MVTCIAVVSESSFECALLALSPAIDSGVELVDGISPLLDDVSPLGSEFGHVIFHLYKAA